jgi:hypothetical protein
MLYQRLGARLKGFAESTPQTPFREFVNTPGRIESTQSSTWMSTSSAPDSSSRVA